MAMRAEGGRFLEDSLSKHPTVPPPPIIEDPEVKLRRLLADFAPLGWDIFKGQPTGLSIWMAERRRGTQITVHVALELDGLRAKLEADQ